MTAIAISNLPSNSRMSTTYNARICRGSRLGCYIRSSALVLLSLRVFLVRDEIIQAPNSDYAQEKCISCHPLQCELPLRSPYSGSGCFQSEPILRSMSCEASCSYLYRRKPHGDLYPGRGVVGRGGPQKEPPHPLPPISKKDSTPS